MTAGSRQSRPALYGFRGNRDERIERWTVKVRVDKQLCTGHARCNVLGPEVYPLDDDGYCAITEAEVPAGLEKQARAGAAGCPERAISIEE